MVGDSLPKDPQLEFTQHSDLIQLAAARALPQDLTVSS